MNSRSQCLEAIDANGRGLRVVFSWNGDRYEHRVESLAEGSATSLVESIEGGEHDPWPPSSPLQQLTIEGRPDDSQVALLVGMAGQSHWSASVSAVSNSRSLLFEMACRTKDSSAAPMSSYRIHDDVQPSATEDNCIRWSQVALSSASASIQLDPANCSLQVRARTAKVRGLTTVQWSYELKWICG